MKHIEKTEIIVTPAMGSEFYDVALESAKIAIEQESTVSVIYNGGKYTITPLDIVKCFVENKGVLNE